MKDGQEERGFDCQGDRATARIAPTIHGWTCQGDRKGASVPYTKWLYKESRVL